MVDGLVRRDRPVPASLASTSLEEAPREVLPPVERRQAGEAQGELVRVDQVMTSPVITLGPDQPVEEALALFEEFAFHHVPLLDGDGRLAGLVSDRDLYAALETPGEPLSQFMTSRLVVATASTYLKEAAGALMAEKISSLPIIDPDLGLQGIVTIADMLSFLVGNPAMELWD